MSEWQSQAILREPWRRDAVNFGWQPLAALQLISLLSPSDHTDACLALEPLSLSLPAAGQSCSSENLSLRWAGPGRWYWCFERTDIVELSRCKAALRSICSFVDKSNGLDRLLLSGPGATTLLSQGSGMDFNSSEFAVEAVAMTSLGYIPVHITRMAEQQFELFVPRSFSSSFSKWLSGQSQQELIV